MITYSNRTLKEVYDEVMIRLGGHRTAENLDWDTIVRLINNSINEVLFKTLAYKDWSYISQMQVANQAVLPVEFIKAVRVMLRSNENNPYHEARYVSPKEFFTLSNWKNEQIWNQGLAQVPIYTLWGNINIPANQAQQFVIWIYPNGQYLQGQPPAGYAYNSDVMQGYMEFYRSHTFLANNGDLIPIPYEYEDILINYILLRIFAKTGNLVQADFIKSQLDPEVKRIQEMFQEKRRTEKRILDSFAEPLVPTVQPATPKNEVPFNLVGGR